MNDQCWLDLTNTVRIVCVVLGVETGRETDLSWQDGHFNFGTNNNEIITSLTLSHTGMAPMG